MVFPIILLILLIIIFVALLFVGTRFIKSNMASATQHLDSISQSYVKKEDEARKKLAEAERTAEETIAKAKGEALSTRKDILEQTQKEKEKILQQAHAQSEELIREGEKTRHLLISELEKKIETESIKKASTLLGGALPEDTRREIHVRLVKELIDAGLATLKKMDVPADISEVKVVSGFALTEENKKSLARALKNQIGKEIKMKEQVSTELIAGLMVVLGSLVVDGSLQFKIRQKVQKLVSKENE
ncbi:MAG: F0F1 ATP synthase subunit delta [Candidatus Omnitrophota bacterium]|nr:MAG: F0F1 ATP synthase subunit delta [Candidatus Omnitrophota bacterium]